MNEETGSVGAVLALWNDVTPELDEAYNAWHATEHVPERLTVPGMRWGRRFRRAAEAAGPRYLTLYGMEDAAVLDSEAYRLLLRRPTATSARMRPHLCNLSRWVCDVRDATALVATARLAVWTFETEEAARSLAAELAPSRSGFLLASRSPTAAPLPWAEAAQVQAIAGNWILAMGLPASANPDPLPGPGAMLYEAL